MTHDMTISATTQEYLETIYNIAMEGDPIVGARLAQHFGVTPPTVTATLQRLVRDGYITLDRRHGAVLTGLGFTTAERVLRRHRLAERFLYEMLGMDWIMAHEQAHAMEHAMTPEIEERLAATLGDPTTCPHGNPIPGSHLSSREYLRDQDARRLSTISLGVAVKVLCLSEVVEDETALLRQAGEAGLRPGCIVTVLAGLNDGVRVAVGPREYDLPSALASRIWVVASTVDKAVAASVR